jgi:hypothetical protein
MLPGSKEQAGESGKQNICCDKRIAGIVDQVACCYILNALFEQTYKTYYF